MTPPTWAQRSLGRLSAHYCALVWCRERCISSSYHDVSDLMQSFSNQTMLSMAGVQGLIMMFDLTQSRSICFCLLVDTSLMMLEGNLFSNRMAWLMKPS